MNKIQFEIQEELRKIAPNLARLREKNSATVLEAPAHYFDSLADNVLAKIKGKNSQIPSIKNNNGSENVWMQFSHSVSNSRLVYRIAATFLIAATAIWLIPKTFNNLKQNTQTANAIADYSHINEEDIRSLINDSKTDIDSDFLTNTLGVTEKELSLKVSDNSANTSDENLNDAIDKYIKENDTITNL